MSEAGLSFVNLIRRCGIDAPVEAESSAGAVLLEALGFGSGGQDKGLRGRAGEEDEKRNRSLHRTENRPVEGAGALKAGVDYVFRMMRLVGLRNHAAALGQGLLDLRRQVGKRADGETANDVWG